MTINPEPSLDSPALEVRRADGQDRQPASQRLLLADDLRSIRDSLGRLLSRQGYSVALAENGREAVERAAAEHFDLLLLDLSMPELNGWEALKRISALKPGLPVVIVTAHSQQRPWVEPSGAWALLEKPLDIPLLLGTIRELTGNFSVPRGSDRADRKPRFSHYPPAAANKVAGVLAKAGLNE